MENNDLKLPIYLEILCDHQKMVIWVHGPDAVGEELAAALKALGIELQLEFCSPCG